MESNIKLLSKALGLELAIIEREDQIGKLPLGLLTKDVGSNEKVVIENQLFKTDHDHLGKLLTYTASLEA